LTFFLGFRYEGPKATCKAYPILKRILAGDRFEIGVPAELGSVGEMSLSISTALFFAFFNFLLVLVFFNFGDAGVFSRGIEGQLGAIEVAGSWGGVESVKYGTGTCGIGPGEGGQERGERRREE